MQQFRGITRSAKQTVKMHLLSGSLSRSRGKALSFNQNVVKAEQLKVIIANGADMFWRIRGYISTATKNSLSAFDAIRSAYQGSPFRPEF